MDLDNNLENSSVELYQKEEDTDAVLDIVAKEDDASPCEVRRKIEDYFERKRLVDEIGFDDLDWALE